MGRFLGLDLSNAEAKFILIDDDRGEDLGSYIRSGAVIQIYPRGSEQELRPGWEKMSQGIRPVLNDSSVRRVGADRLSGQLHRFVPLDSPEPVIRPTIPRNVQRSVEHCPTVGERPGIRRVFGSGGELQNLLWWRNLADVLEDVVTSGRIYLPLLRRLYPLRSKASHEFGCLVAGEVS